LEGNVKADQDKLVEFAFCEVGGGNGLLDPEGFAKGGLVLDDLLPDFALR